MAHDPTSLQCCQRARCTQQGPLHQRSERSRPCRAPALPRELPMIPPELTQSCCTVYRPFQLLGLAKLTMESASQYWVSKMERLFSLTFVSEWMVALLMPAKHVLEMRSTPRFHVGERILVPRALLRPQSCSISRPRVIPELLTDRSVVSRLTSNPKVPTLHGCQLHECIHPCRHGSSFFFLARARCLSAGLETYSSTTSQSRPHTRGNRSAARCLCTVLRRALYYYATSLCIVPPMYRSLRRESIKTARSQNAMGVKTLCPTWFEDETVARAAVEGTSNTLDPCMDYDSPSKKMRSHFVSSCALQPRSSSSRTTSSKNMAV